MSKKNISILTDLLKCPREMEFGLPRSAAGINQTRNKKGRKDADNCHILIMSSAKMQQTCALVHELP